MKKLLFAVAVAIFVIPMYQPLYGQDGVGFGADSVDLSGLLGGDRGGGNRGNGRNNIQIPVSKEVVDGIEATLKKGNTPLDKTQKKPLQSLVDKEVVDLSDRIQILRNNNSNNNNNNFNNGGQEQPQGGRGGRGGGRGGEAGQQANNQQNNQNNQQPTAQEIKVETITSLSNDEFIENKLSLFLTPEQAALIKKARADDKSNSNCLGGLLDRVFNQLQNPNRGNQNNNNQNYNNNNQNRNNAKRPNGQSFCMTQEATAAERLEPIRKVLSKGNLPLAKEKESIAEIVMKSQIQDLEGSLRAGLTTNNNGGGRGNQNNNNQNRNNNPQQVIQTATDNMYKKVEAFLKPDQAEVLKKWHYEQMLGRGGIESLAAIEAMQDTPLTDEQFDKVTAAWPTLRSQIQTAAKAAGQNITDKQRDSAAMEKILRMLEPSQEAAYRMAVKYGPQVAAGK